MKGMSSTEEMVWAGGVVAAGGVVVSVMAHLTPGGGSWTDVLIGLPIAAALLACAVALATFMKNRNVRITGSRISRRIGRERSTINLDQVSHVVWEHETPFKAGATDYLGFYDDDPHLRMTIFGTVPANDSAQRLGTLRTGQLRARVREEIQRRADSGDLTVHVDLRNGEPLPGRLPPLEEGTEFTEEGDMIRHPQARS